MCACVPLQLWKEVSGQLFFAVLTFQLVMLGLLGLKASLLLPCSLSQLAPEIPVSTRGSSMGCLPTHILRIPHLPTLCTCGLQPCHCAACAGRLDLVPS